MKTLNYEALYDAVDNGARFRFNFEKRTFHIEGFDLDNDTLFNKQLCGYFDKESWDMERVIQSIESCYYYYKHSVPSERSENRRKSYFRALPEKDLTDEDMMYGLRRETARFELELRVYAFIVLGLFVWDEQTMGKWFWQSSNDKDLVILRDWVEPKRED